MDVFFRNCLRQLAVTKKELKAEVARLKQERIKIITQISPPCNNGIQRPIPISTGIPGYRCVLVRCHAFLDRFFSEVVVDTPRTESEETVLII